MPSQLMVWGLLLCGAHESCFSSMTTYGVFMSLSAGQTLGPRFSDLVRVGLAMSGFASRHYFPLRNLKLQPKDS